MTAPKLALSAAILVLIAACGGAPPAPKMPMPKTATTTLAASPEPPRPAPHALAPLDVDPVEVATNEAGVVRLCDESLARAGALLEEIRALSGKPDAALTWETTLRKFDSAKLAMKNAGDFPALMAVAHPDRAGRAAAKTCEPKVDEFETAMFLDAAVAGAIKRYAAKKEPLTGPRARLLEHALRDYRRNGLELDAKGQARLREINEALTKLGQDFETNLAGATLTMHATPKELVGLPSAYLESHKPGPDGRIAVTTDYPDYFPVIQYAKDRAFALELFKKFDNRAADTNVAILDKLLALRHEKAKLLGYATWADYVLEPRMAKTSQNVATFLEGLRKHLEKKGEREMKDFVAMHVKLGGKKDDAIPPSDRTYLEDQIRKEKYGLDSKEVSEYFEVQNVRQGILDITSKLFQITYREVQKPAWHADVKTMEVLGAGGKLLGRFYFDLYPREGKYKHAAVFSIRDTRTTDDGSRLLPIAAIECNFPKPGAGAPALMSHQDVTTFFHEFGHVLHHLLSESELVSFSGTSVARDFVESPSQMLEEWAWSKETLDLFAKHYKTGKPIPDKLFSAMTRSRAFGRGLMTQRQLFLAALDQSYHTREPGFDTTQVLSEIQGEYTPFKYVPGTHFQATFGHLIGYDAGYYGYQWALSIARDLFTRFQKEGLLNPKTAADYRAAVLAPGGSEDEAKLVEHFLGRPPSDAAYRKFLVE